MSAYRTDLDQKHAERQKTDLEKWIEENILPSLITAYS
jgi:hypothetical protein